MTIPFSIIMPVFNRALKVRRAIDSVKRAAQHAQMHVEIVVIDDDSSDNSAEAARSSGADIVLRLEANVGVTGARNRGIKAAQGEYLIILDSDDEMQIDAFLLISRHFERFPSTDILFGACTDHAGNPMHRPSARFGTLAFEQMLVHRIPGEFLPVARRRVFESLAFEGELRGFESITWLKAARSGFVFHYVDEVLRIYDKEGDDRLCRKENIIRGADRMSRGWGFYLNEFGTDLWRLDKRAFMKVVLRCAIYGRLQPRNAAKPETVLRNCGPLLPQLLFVVTRALCALVPRSLLEYYLLSR